MKTLDDPPIGVKEKKEGQDKKEGIFNRHFQSVIQGLNSGRLLTPQQLGVVPRN